MVAMCRICLSEYVSMKSIENTALQDVYQKLTLRPFKCEDSRPQSVCFLCLALLRSARRLMEACQRAEQLFAQKLETGEPISKIQIFADSPVTLSSSTLETINCYPKSARNDNLLGETEECTNVEIEQEEELQLSDYEPCGASNEEITVKEQTMTRNNIDTELSEPVSDPLQTHHIANDHNTEVIHRENSRFKLRNCYVLIEDLCSKRTVGQASEMRRIDKQILSSNRRNQLDHDTYQKNRKHEEVLRRHKCNVCKLRLTQRSHLIMHMRKHTGEKPFECAICQKKFSRKCDLLVHMRRHTGVKPHKCCYCNMKFVCSSDLTKHARKHTGEKLFACECCNKAFVQLRSLKRHLLTHRR